MNRRLVPIALACGLLAGFAAPVASAQPTVMNASCAKDWHGEDNEFGKMCMKFQDSMVGKPITVKAHVRLHHVYEEREAAYFLFAFVGKGTPFELTDVRLTTADGRELPVYQRQTEGGDHKIIVDVADMPRAETELLLSATVGSCERGLYHLGALVQPFNYRWQRLVMGNGEAADIYGFTQIGVNEATCRGGIPGLPQMSVPAWGLLGAVAAFGAAAVVSRRR